MMPGASFTAFWEADHYDPDKDQTGPEGLYNETGTDYVKGHIWGVKMAYQLTDKITGFTRYSDHQYEGKAWRTELVWAMADGLSLAGRYTKTLPPAGVSVGRYELELTRSF
jgi:hypothetical protein